MSKKRILVVEDNMDTYELVRFILEKTGYETFLAMNGRDGVNAAKKQIPDLIIMDKDPLNNIRNTETISSVMVNGRLYNAEEMNEIGNHTKPKPKFYWELNKNSNEFPLQESVDED